MKCRHCQSEHTLPFCDLGAAPPSNAYLTAQRLDEPELSFPLRVRVCTECWLVQTQDFAQADHLFDADYGYFSSMSTSWVDHASRYVAEMSARLALDTQSHVVEVASNDGYLLQHVMARGIPCLGIEPTASTAAAARTKGIPTREVFFESRVADELVAQGLSADLTVANNVLAHVPDINDFVLGFARLLKPQGVATFEFPHLLQLIRHSQFDTLYHEHYSCLSLLAVDRIFRSQGLQAFDVQELPSHGGSIRVFAQRALVGQRPVEDSVRALIEQERFEQLDQPTAYQRIQTDAERIKDDFLMFLIKCRRDGKKVGAYGAAAKGNTLLNFAGVRPDLLPYVVDRSPGKLGRFMPGSRIPIVNLDHLLQQRPDIVVILPWNLREEISDQLGFIRAWGGQFAIAVPRLQVF